MKKTELYRTPLSYVTEVNGNFAVCTSPDQNSAGDFEENEFELL